MFWLKILVGVRREEQVTVMKALIAKSARRKLHIVKGYSTGVPIVPEEKELFHFVSDERFAEMEKRFEFAHVDSHATTKRGYRWVDLEAALKSSDVLISFDTFDEIMDRSSLSALRSLKKVIDRNGDLVPLSFRSFGDMRRLCEPPN